MVTAYVQGREAENYKFTSALPVTILKLLAPAIMEHGNIKALPPAPVPAAAKKPANVKVRDISFRILPAPTAARPAY